MGTKVLTICVCGGSPEEYDFLLGCLDRHLSYGRLLVLDTMVAPFARRFRLPSSVRWLHRPIYGSGWAEFRFADALNDALDLAAEESPDVVVHADADEYFDHRVVYAIEAALGAVVEVKTLHHLGPTEAVDFETEWHRRLWPWRAGVRFADNPDWIASEHYNGNPQYHPRMLVPEGVPTVRELRTPHHHVHYCLGEKAAEQASAAATIPGWPDKGAKVALEGCWPAPLQLWKEKGARPSAALAEETML